MTSQDIYNEILASLGNRTDLAQVANAPRIVRWMNWAILEICGMHRKRVVTPKRFHALEDITKFSTYVETGVAQGGSLTTIILAFTAPIADYADFVIEITSGPGIGQTGLVKSYAQGARIATMTESWIIAPTVASNYAIYQRRYTLGVDVPVNAIDNLWAIEKIEDANTGTPLDQKDWETVSGSQYTQIGTPAQYARYGNQIIFDQTPNSIIFYRVYYYKIPTLLTSAGIQSGLEIPILPSNWHEAIVDGAVYRGFRKLMEPDRAGEARAEFIDSVVNRKTDIQFEEKQKQKAFKVRVT